MRMTRKKLIINILVGLVFMFVILTFYSTFSIDTEYTFDSMVYDIEDAYIKNVSVNTTVELYKKYFEIDNCSVKVVDKDNKEITDGLVVNGSKTVLYDTNDNVLASYTNIIKGDFNSDGIIDVNDFSDMGECLVSECSIEEDLMLSVDIDDNGNFNNDDITLLDKAVTLGYTGVTVNKEEAILQSDETTRIVAKVEPNYGINQNVKWTSLDEGIVTVDESGIVTGHKEGETYIVATTMDGSYEDRTKIKVDNTIQLNSYEGIGYVGGNDVIVNIKAINYEGISCSVSNETIASCKIDGKKMSLKALASGEVIITVTSSKYGEVTYKFNTYSVYLNIMPKYLCMQASSSKLITVSPFNAGELSFEFGDKDIISSAYMTDYNTVRMLRVDSGTKQGRTTLKVTEGNAFVSNIVTIDVYSFSISDIGKVRKIGEEVSTTINGGNLGELSCISSDVSKGTCRIEGNQLIVTPLKPGYIEITIYNKFDYNGEKYYCGETLFAVYILSNDTSIKSLEIKDYEIDFNSDILKYNLRTKGEEKLDIKVTLNDEKSTYKITGNENLKNSGIIKIDVTAEDGTVVTYEVVVYNPSKDATIKSLKIKNYDIGFKSNVYNYKLNINDENKLDLEVILNNSKSRYEIIGNNNLKNNSSIEIRVTAENGDIASYIIVVNKKEKVSSSGNIATKLSNDATIKNLIIKGYNLDFKEDVYKYELETKKENKLDIEVVLNSNKAKYKVIGNNNLVNGSIVRIEVTAEDGTKAIYAITVKQVIDLSSDATIKGIVIKNYSINFKSDIYEYDLEIKDEDKLDIEVVLSDEKSKYEIIGNYNLDNNSVIEIKVIAEDGTNEVYKINIRKLKNSNSIINNIGLIPLIGAVILIIVVLVVKVLKTKFVKN